jgi:hypothetical protein
MWRSIKTVVTSKAFKHAVALILLLIAETLAFGSERGRIPRD